MLTSKPFQLSLQNSLHSRFIVDVNCQIELTSAKPVMADTIFLQGVVSCALLLRSLYALSMHVVRISGLLSPLCGYSVVIILLQSISNGDLSSIELVSSHQSVNSCAW